MSNNVQAVRARSIAYYAAFATATANRSVGGATPGCFPNDTGVTPWQGGVTPRVVPQSSLVAQSISNGFFAPLAGGAVNGQTGPTGAVPPNGCASIR